MQRLLLALTLQLSSEEEELLRKETRLLLGLCLDSRARYRASTLRLDQARQDYQSALEICRQEQGDAHPQVSAYPATSCGHNHFVLRLFVGGCRRGMELGGVGPEFSFVKGQLE